VPATSDAAGTVDELMGLRAVDRAAPLNAAPAVADGSGMAPVFARTGVAAASVTGAGPGSG